MADQDFFAKVALKHHPVGKDELLEPQPVCYPMRFFNPSTLVADPVIERSYAEDLDKFRADLARLRERYRPFMEDYTPVPDLERPLTQLKQFQFRYEAEEDRDFSGVLAGQGPWEEVTIPDYRGPVGKWTGFYRTEFVVGGARRPGKRLFLRFLGVDYIANVYVNGRYVGGHEGFFAPFEFDVTGYVRDADRNVLVVEVKNDAPTLGLRSGNEQIDGDKLYAATGPGWDDPQSGWHHCPPGGGIYNRVLLEERATLFVDSIFVRPDIDQTRIEAWVEIFNTGNHNQEFELRLSLYPRNFQEEAFPNVRVRGEPAGPGVNYYRFIIPMPGYRLWSPQEPWLYVLRASLSRQGRLEDQKDCQFGMRKFHMDEAAEPKGTLYLNNRPIILRGANEMGHLQQCVMREDYDQLVEDILIAKLAHMNYYRITQRPVQEEIYDYFDRLGMMHQCDFPLFGYLRRNQFSQAVKQAGEMERLIRSHPSSIMVTFINEPFPIGPPDGEEQLYVSYASQGHRHLYRDELEAFFKAAQQAILVENPDRIIKNVEGDYDPPTTSGLSDFHCYTLWYTNHALPVGKFYKGYLPAIKRGWKTGCGEYGTEGLDNYAVMVRHYPRDWLPVRDDAEWRPDKIVQAQTNSMHGDWFEEQSQIRDWIAASQRHQAFATAIMTDALRRRSDLVVSTALHLLIDAWPAGWMKAVIGVDRVPKPAYFAFQRSLEPLRVNLRCDRWKVYGGETVEVEAWLLNDTPDTYSKCRLVVTIRDDEQIHASYEIACDGQAVSPTYAGTLQVSIPQVQDRQWLYLDASLLDADGKRINQERFTLEAAVENRPISSSRRVAYLGKQAEHILQRLRLRASNFFTNPTDFDAILISSCAECSKHQAAIMERVKRGATAILVRDGQQPTPEWDIAGRLFPSKEINGVFFLAFDTEDQRMKDSRPGDFSYWYNRDNDMIDFIADRYFESEELTPLLFTYAKPGFLEAEKGKKKRLAVVGSIPSGQGEVILSNLLLAGRVGFNPILDRFLTTLLTKR